MVRRTKRSPKASNHRYKLISKDVDEAKEVITNDGLVFYLQGRVPTGRIFITNKNNTLLGIYNLAKAVGEINNKSKSMTFREFINSVRASHKRFLERKSFANAR